VNVYTVDSVVDVVGRSVDRGAGVRARQRLADLRNRFGDWLAHGPDAPKAVVEEVESALEEALSDAARLGRIWGAAEGIAWGLAGGLVTAAAAVLIAVLS
jgi:hypothetical protein